VVLRSSDRISRVPPYLIRPVMLRIRGYHPLWPCFPTCSSHTQGSAGPRSLAATRGVSIDFLSSGYLDVSVPRVCSFKPMYSVQKYLVQQDISSHHIRRYERLLYQTVRWVAPFRNPWIKAYSQLPMAYRRVSRLSSPLTAKAFTKRPSRA
jgi:hypothetical protein